MQIALSELADTPPHRLPGHFPDGDIHNRSIQWQATFKLNCTFNKRCDFLHKNQYVSAKYQNISLGNGHFCDDQPYVESLSELA